MSQTITWPNENGGTSSLSISTLDSIEVDLQANIDEIQRRLDLFRSIRNDPLELLRKRRHISDHVTPSSMDVERAIHWELEHNPEFRRMMEAQIEPILQNNAAFIIWLKDQPLTFQHPHMQEPADRLCVSTFWIEAWIAEALQLNYGAKLTLTTIGPKSRATPWRFQEPLSCGVPDWMEKVLRSCWKDPQSGLPAWYRSDEMLECVMNALNIPRE